MSLARALATSRPVVVALNSELNMVALLFLVRSLNERDYWLATFPVA